MHAITYRPKQFQDNPWIRAVAQKFWGSEDIITKDHTYTLTRIPTVVAAEETKPIGFISYVITHDTCEIVAVYSEKEHQGIGSALIEKVKEEAEQQNCRTLWLLTTNDNTDALQFYQKRGFSIVNVRKNEIDKQRKHKPIPLLGMHGIPIHDEIELVMKLR